MHTIDWIFVALPLALVACFAFYTRRFVKSVADFLSAGRCAGRYLLANARGEADSGLANTLSKFEVVLVSGFVLNFWEKVSVPVLLLIGITGFVVYRFRETRAMTLAQFFEVRYSRRYRLFMGALAFLSGILNYGIFPAVSARFFVHFLGLPTSVDLGAFAIPTVALIMFTYLSFTVFMITMGGQVTLMVTDCIEGLLSHLIYIAIFVALVFVISWSEIVEVMSAAPAGHSLIDPFDAHEVEDFNIWFVLMSLLISVYTTMALQNKQGFNSAARTPHESRMGHVLGHWRTYARLLMILMLGICAVTFLKHPDFAGSAGQINAQIATIADPYIQKQMTVPITLSHMLPIGIKGLFCAIMIMGLLAGDSGHMHSWGSILVQDVILPLRRRPLTPRQHIWALRFAVIGVAAFAFIFSLVFQQTQYIALWWALTAGVFVGGAGAAIIGGLYWKKGTAQAAWAAQITGSGLALAGILCTNRITWRWIVGRAETLGIELPTQFWLNGMEMAFLAACIAMTAYVVVSLFTSREDFNLDMMLHRGQYSVEGTAVAAAVIPVRDRFRLKNILQFDANFTFTDKLVSGGIFWWAILLLIVNAIVSVWNLAFYDWPVVWWSRYWLITGIGFPFLIALATLVWFGIGGIRDMKGFFATLRTMARDASDDGRVPVVEVPATTAAPETVGVRPQTEPSPAVPPVVMPAP